MSEISISLDGFNNRLNTAKKRINKQETNVKEHIKSNSREKKIIKIRKRNMWKTVNSQYTKTQDP